MATQTFARWTLVSIALVAMLLLAGCGDDDNKPEPSFGPGPGTPIPSGTTLYQDHGIAFAYPDDWTVTEEEGPDGQLVIHVESTAGSNLYIDTDPKSNQIEVPNGEPGDEAAIELIVNQVVRQIPTPQREGY